VAFCNLLLLVYNKEMDQALEMVTTALRSYNLSEPQLKVYTGLIHFGSGVCAEIESNLGGTVKQVNETLSELFQKGLVTQRGVPPIFTAKILPELIVYARHGYDGRSLPNDPSQTYLSDDR
jgi:predicted DNA-binding transcriptional regulator